jgi:tricorn protease
LTRCVNKNNFRAFSALYGSKIFCPFEMLYYQIVKTKLHPLNQPLSHFLLLHSDKIRKFQQRKLFCMRKLALTIGCFVTASSLYAQIDAGLFRFPDVSKDQIVFTYANDLWVAPKDGGSAIKLSSPSGVESFPKFSPDGKSIAFTGNYDGNSDVYVLPTSGGVPVRLTSHGYPDRVVDGASTVKRFCFASSRESGKVKVQPVLYCFSGGWQCRKIAGGLWRVCLYSPMEKQLALVFRTQVGRN